MELTLQERALVVRPRVLVVAGDLAFAETVAEGLGTKGFEALPAASGVEAAHRLEHESFAALVTDLRMGTLDGLALLGISKRESRLRPVLLMAEYGAVGLALEAIRRGAYHYLMKPFELDELAVFLERALLEARERGAGFDYLPEGPAGVSLSDVIGSSEKMVALRGLVERVADTSASILISGEVGTGKATLARAIHTSGPRRNAAFIALNCAALSALPHSPFEQADGGTLFFNEIGMLPLPVQAQVLHLLESHSVDVRAVASSSLNLGERVQAGLFRADLLYRIGVVHLEVPPLRERLDDIPGLVKHFVACSRRTYAKSAVRRFTPDAIALLCEHAWPGNLRELAQCIDRLVHLGTMPEITKAQLRAVFAPTWPPAASFHGAILPLREIGRRYAHWALEQSGGKKMITAERLQIDDKTLNKILIAEADGGTDATYLNKGR